VGKLCAGIVSGLRAFAGLARLMKMPDVVGAGHAGPREWGVPATLVVQEFEAVRRRLFDAARGVAEPVLGFFELLDLGCGSRPAIRLRSRDVSWRLRESAGRKDNQRRYCPAGKPAASAWHSHLTLVAVCHRRPKRKVRASLGNT
jgi:hypothetical protein